MNINTELLSHLMDLKAASAAQSEVLTALREDLKEHTQIHAVITSRVERLETWPHTIKTIIKIVTTVAALITGSYGAIQVLRPAQAAQSHPAP